MPEPADTSQTRSTSTSVVVRHVTLVDGADLKVHEDRTVFVALDDPPPIRTVVQLWRGDEARAVVVQRVIETPAPDSDEARGFFGVPASEEAIAGATKVGTEHLESPSGDDPDGSGGQAGSDTSPDGNINMAMPAPVLVHDQRDEGDEGSEDSVQSESGPDESDESDESEASAESEGAAKSGRRRRGRGKKRK